MIARAPDTKTRILDAAEKLFGENGFDATSLRDITAEAEVNLAAVNYHFQSKESLIDAVIARRIEPVNQRRLQMLDAAGPNLTLEQILIAFLLPVFEVDLKQIAPLMGRIMATPDSFVLDHFKRHLTSVLERFTNEITNVLPLLSPADVMWRLHFTAGSMAQVITRSHLLKEMTNGVCDPTDRSAALARLVTFAAAGFRATEEF